jgi:hypothetical protein
LTEAVRRATSTAPPISLANARRRQCSAWGVRQWDIGQPPDLRVQL